MNTSTMTQLPASEPLEEVLTIAQLFLERAENDITSALYSVYMHYRERYLREAGLIDTVSSDPAVRDLWQRVRDRARAVEALAQSHWAQVVRRSPGYASISLSPVAGTLEMEALEHAQVALEARGGHLPDALHAVGEFYRDRVRGEGEAAVNHRDPETAFREAASIVCSVNLAWANAITEAFDRARDAR